MAKRFIAMILALAFAVAVVGCKKGGEAGGGGGGDDTTTKTATQ